MKQKKICNTQHITFVHLKTVRNSIGGIVIKYILQKTPFTTFLLDSKTLIMNTKDPNLSRNQYLLSFKSHLPKF